jgi:putative tricarboxylic transport membrane protein
MLSRDSISGLICLAISLFLLFLTLGLPPATMVPIGPAFYPRIVLVLTAFLSLTLIVMDVRAMRAARTAGPLPPAAAPSTPPANYRLVLATFALFGLYIALLPGLGFRIATFLFVFALQITLEWPETTKRWVIALIVALGTAVVCHFVFEDYLSVLLPRGTWSGM